MRLAKCLSGREVPAEEWNRWVVIDEEGVDLCMFDPRHPVTATVETNLHTLTRIWRGEHTWLQSQRSGALQVHGPSHVARALPRWLPKTMMTGTPQSV